MMDSTCLLIVIGAFAGSLASSWIAFTRAQPMSRLGTIKADLGGRYGHHLHSSDAVMLGLPISINIDDPSIVSISRHVNVIDAVILQSRGSSNGQAA